MTEDQIKKIMEMLSGSDDVDKGAKLTEVVESALSEKQKKRLEEILGNRELAEKLLASPEAQRLMKKLNKGDGN